jgi:hypothetical protein
VLTISEPPVIPPGDVALLSATHSFTIVSVAQESDIPPNQAQFWPDNRGPPALNANTNLLDVFVMASTQRSTGGAST